MLELESADGPHDQDAFPSTVSPCSTGAFFPALAEKRSAMERNRSLRLRRRLIQFDGVVDAESVGMHQEPAWIEDRSADESDTAERWKLPSWVEPSPQLSSPLGW